MSSLYQIGVRMTMDASQTSAILRVLAHEFIGLHHHIGNATLALGRFRQALVGAGMAFAGTGLVKGLANVVEHGNSMVKIQQQMMAAGWRNKEIQEATAKAWELSNRNQSIAAAEILEMQKELAPVLGDRHHAIEMAEQMTKLMVSFQGAFGVDSAAQFHRQVRDAIRAGELSANILQPERFAAYLDGMAKTLKAFGGTITPSDYFMATKYGRAGALNWSDEFTNTILPTIMQELGAASTGTGLMTLYQAVVGGRMRLRSIKAMDDLGLIDRTKLNPDTDLTPEGRIKRLSPGSVVGSRLLMENPFDWVWQEMIPAMLRKGIVSQEGIEAIKRGEIKDGIGAEARKAITENVAVMFGDRTAQGIVDLLAIQWKKITRDQRLIRDAMGLDEGTEFFKSESYDMAKVAVFQQWENLLTALGGPGVPMATRALQGLANALNAIAEWAVQNPEMASGIVTVTAGLATGLVTIGGALLTMAILGAAGPGILLTGLATGIAAMAALNWDGIKRMGSSLYEWAFGRDEYMDAKGGHHARQKGVFHQLADWFSEGGRTSEEWGRKAREWVNGKIGEIGAAASKLAAEIANTMIDAIKSIPGMVVGAINEMASAIGQKISSAISSILGWIGISVGGGSGATDGAKAGAGGAVIPQSYVPPASGGGKAIKVHTQLNIDGRRFAQAASYHIARGSRHVHAAGGYDPIRAPTPVDFQYI